MSVVIYPNRRNVGKATHVPVYISMLEGPYGGILLWPLLGKVKLELVNQLSDDQHFGKELCLHRKVIYQWDHIWVYQIYRAH